MKLLRWLWKVAYGFTVGVIVLGGAIMVWVVVGSGVMR